MTRRDEVYLGDGLYAYHDGYAVWLRAPREGGDHAVALEPEVLDAFIAYIEELKHQRDEPTPKLP